MQNVQSMDLAISEVLGEVNEEQLPKYTLYSHPDLLGLSIPPMRWIIGMMIPNPGLVVISGRPGSYKTFFALWLGFRASLNQSLFAEYDEGYFCDEEATRMKESVPTLFIEEENTVQTMKERAFGFRGSSNGEPEALFYLIDVGFKFKSPAWREEVLRIIEEKRIKLLILDPFSSVMGLQNENDNAEVAEVMDVIRKEFVQRGLSVILIHHPSKGDGDGKGIRGAGDILGKCDVHLSLEVENESEKVIRATYQKLRVADRNRVSDFRMRMAGDGAFRDLHFRYLGRALSKGIEERNEFAQQILAVMEKGQEYSRKDVAQLLDTSTSAKRFSGVWKNLMQQKKIGINVTTKRFYNNIDNSRVEGH